jgi:hypothetical protein
MVVSQGVFMNRKYFYGSQKWNRFSQKSRITSIKREKLFPLVFINFDVKYCILKKTVRGAA